MTKVFKITLSFLTILSIAFISVPALFANNLSIDNVSLEERNPSNDTVMVQFDVSWENSWKTKSNHDAVWVTVRLYDPAVTPISKNICELSGVGLNPAGFTAGDSTNIDIYVPSDKKGAFIRPKNFGVVESLASNEVQFKIDYASCGFTDESEVKLNVFALEMVYIPEGEFYVGDYGTSSASLMEGNADTDPWYISSDSSISVSNATNDGYLYSSAGNATEDPTGSSFSISASYPKGYGDFYVMKYEITEGQWSDFFNALASNNARSNRDLTNSGHKSTDTVQSRNTLNCSGASLACSTDRPSRAVGFLSWMDLAAFLDWAALRPLTELEFEKISRGPLVPTEGEFAWGDIAITAATSISGADETGTETILTANANANYNNISFTGGDSSSGADYSLGPLRSGIFAQENSTRVLAGAGYYGVMELSGNLMEQLVTIGNATGRGFAGTHGDGVLSSASGFEGNANELDWPGIDAVTSRGVTSAIGSGLRGGSFIDASTALRISDRSQAANGQASSFSDVGGRGARTYDGSL